MSDRARLPNRRQSELVEFEQNGVTYIASCSRYADDNLGEIFLDGAKIGTGAQIAGREAAVTASLCFQHGVNARSLLHSLEKLANGSAAGPLGRALELLGDT
jgi:hypothetical protein